VSLLETRFLLGKLPNIRNGFWQAAVLLFDLFITAAIIIAVIWVVQQLGLFSGDYDDPLAVILAFSIFTAPFYSTFLPRSGPGPMSWRYGRCACSAGLD
jgi:hypothetical protein